MKYLIRALLALLAPGEFLIAAVQMYASERRRKELVDLEKQVACQDEHRAKQRAKPVRRYL